MWETLTVILMVPGTLFSVFCIVDWLKNRKEKQDK